MLGTNCHITMNKGICSRNFMIYHLDQLIHCNLDKHIVAHRDKIRYGHIKCIYKDNNKIKNVQIGTIGKSAQEIHSFFKTALCEKIQVPENIRRVGTFCSELAGQGHTRSCICLVEGQEPCPTYEPDHKRRKMREF